MNDLVADYWLYFLLGQYPKGPLGGLALTLALASLALVLALPLGVLLGLARVSPIAALRRPVTVLVYVVRGLPLLMVIFWACSTCFRTSRRWKTARSPPSACGASRRRRRRRPRWRCCGASGWRTRPPPTRPSSPAASSSGWPSRAPWRCSRR